MEIKVLDKEISELIAAGEVVERPASVVKELVENSIDAGATRISVEIKNGGVTLILVRDNGKGIAEEDIPTAFKRHATSKINGKEDLDKILTLGFRGEALASICAVSKVEVFTKRESQEYGIHYVIEGGEEVLTEETGCYNGTTMIVKNLFYNVPARQKFLKKDVTEGNAITNVIQKMALSHPEIEFHFLRDNCQAFYSSGDGSLYSAIYSIYGKEIAYDMLETDYTHENRIKVSGYVIKPLFSKGNRKYQNFFINGRYIKSQLCSTALEEAYKGLVTVGRFPCCVLNLEIPPETVDVNVHPTKAEVRFSDERSIFNAIYFATKNTLMQNNLIYEFGIDEKNVPLKSVKQYVPATEQQTIPLQEPTSEKKTEENPPLKEPEKEKTIAERLEQLPNYDFNEQPYMYIDSNSLTKPVEEDRKTEPEQVEEKLISDLDSEPIRVVGELFKNYILAESGENFIIMDKHAGHERINYEKLKNNQIAPESQLVMDVSSVLVSEEEFQALYENTELLKNMGFELDFSKKPYVSAKAIPVFLKSCNMDEIIPEIAENIYNHKINPQTHIIDDMFHSLACKSSIRANDKTSIQELQKLAEDIWNNPEIRHCPHGRPIVFVLTKKDIEKQFKRI